MRFLFLAFLLSGCACDGLPEPAVDAGSSDLAEAPDLFCRPFPPGIECIHLDPSLCRCYDGP